MKRRAYIEHKGYSLGINTLYIAQKDFKIDDLNWGDFIDLISLKVVRDGGKMPEFFLELTHPYNSVDHYDQPYGTVFAIEGVVDAYGRYETIGYIGRGESKDFTCYVP